jgi:uncharacterized protein with PIN domain
VEVARRGGGHVGDPRGLLRRAARRLNLAESLILIRDRQPALADDLESRLLTSGIRFVAPDTTQAQTAARARLRFPLNLGDCFAYALAVAEACPILTIDPDFRVVDRPVVRPTG